MVTRKVAAKKTATPTDERKSLGDSIAKAIVDGDLDGSLETIDDALTKRLNARAKQTAVAPTGTTAKKEKVVAPPPKKSASAPPPVVSPKPETVYLISERLKNISGAKVVFKRFKDEEKTKAVVVMQTDKPGNPKGKRVVVPVGALVEVPSASSPAKKAAAKRAPAKSAAKPLAKKVAAKKRTVKK